MILIRLLPLVAVLALTGCANSVTQNKAETVPELKPGIPAGYLSRAALPNSLVLLPPPPAQNSQTLAADNAAYEASRAQRGSQRWNQSVADSNLRFPDAAGAFSCALGVPITQEAMPHLYMLLRRSMVDAGLSTYAAKDHWKRTRPFVVHNETTCTPNDEPALVKDGSYPSGHAAIGWAWALVLSELAPDKSDSLLARGLEYGQSRVICNAHWQSDVQSGQVMAAGVIAKLHADPVFQRDMSAAKQELTAVFAKGVAPLQSCGSRTAEGL